MMPLLLMTAGMRRKNPRPLGRLRRGGIATRPVACSRTPASTASTSLRIAARRSTSRAFKSNIRAVPSGRIATDEKIAVGLGPRIEPALLERGAQWPQLAIHQAHRGLPQRSAVESLQPALIFPQHPMEKVGACQQRHRPEVRQPRWMDFPEQLHRLGELTLPNQGEHFRYRRTVNLLIAGAH